MLHQKEIVLNKDDTENFLKTVDIVRQISDMIDLNAMSASGGLGSLFAASVNKQIERLEKQGFGNLPICMAKNQYSLSDDPTLLGRPEDFSINIRDVYVSAGAGFVVALTGAIMTMPGLPKTPAAYNIDVTDEGVITGLF